MLSLPSITCRPFEKKLKKKTFYVPLILSCVFISVGNKHLKNKVPVIFTMMITVVEHVSLKGIKQRKCWERFLSVQVCI